MAEAKKKPDFGNVGGSGGGPGGKRAAIRLALMGLVVLLGVGGGMLVGSLAAQDRSDPADRDEWDDSTSPQDGAAWSYYEGFEPVVVTLNEPRVDRYLRSWIILKIRSSDYPGAVVQIEASRREMDDWMIRYLSGLSLQEVRGQQNINRVGRQIRDAFNEQLWPNGRGRIHEVLIKDFAIQ